MRTSDDVLALIEADAAALAVLRAAASLGLPDWWIGAGFVRNRVWDRLTGAHPRPERDVDLAFFDPADLLAEREQVLEAAASALVAAPWEIRNQARMHLRNGEDPYPDALGAIARWPETATCVAVTLREGRLVLGAPHGIEDLVTLTVRPSPAFDTPAGRERVRQRVEEKGWRERWPGLSLHLPR